MKDLGNAIGCTHWRDISIKSHQILFIIILQNYIVKAERFGEIPLLWFYQVFDNGILLCKMSVARLHDSLMG